MSLVSSRAGASFPPLNHSRTTARIHEASIPFFFFFFFALLEALHIPFSYLPLSGYPFPDGLSPLNFFIDHDNPPPDLLVFPPLRRSPEELSGVGSSFSYPPLALNPGSAQTPRAGFFIGMFLGGPPS